MKWDAFKKLQPSERIALFLPALMREVETTAAAFVEQYPAVNLNPNARNHLVLMLVEFCFITREWSSPRREPVSTKEWMERKSNLPTLPGVKTRPSTMGEALLGVIRYHGKLAFGWRMKDGRVVPGLMTIVDEFVGKMVGARAYLMLTNLDDMTFDQAAKDMHAKLGLRAAPETLRSIVHTLAIPKRRN